jgi:type IV secretion system protein VirB8
VFHGFEDEVFFSLRRQRNVFGWIAVLSLLIALAAVAAVAMLTPLKEVRPYVVMVDSTTGAAEKIVEVRPVGLSEQDAVRQAELVRYVAERETYDAADNAERIPDVLGRSAGQAADSLRALWTPSNPEYPPNLYGREVLIRVVVKSVAILDEATAQVRFQKTREAASDRPVTRDFVATLGFEFRPRVERRLEAVWENPLGFTVTSFRVDAETLQSRSE